MDGKDILFWSVPKGNGWENKAVKYVVYRFGSDEKVDIGDASKIVSITSECFFELPKTVDYGRGGKDTYVVTALDRMNNESSPKKAKVKR